MGGVALLILIFFLLWYLRRRSRRGSLDADMGHGGDMTEDARSRPSLVTPYTVSSGPLSYTALSTSDYSPRTPDTGPERSGLSVVPSSKEIRLEYGGGLQRRQSELEARLASGVSAEGDEELAAIRRELVRVRAQMEELRNSSARQDIDPPPSYAAGG